MRVRIILLSFFVFFISVSFAQKKQYTTKSKKAIKLYEQALEMMGGYNRNFDGAFANLEKAVQIDPNFGEAHQTLGDNYRLFQRNDVAKSHYEAIVRSYPKNATFIASYYHLGDLYHKEGEYAKAISEFQRVIDVGAHTAKIVKSSEQRLEACKVAQGLVANAYPLVEQMLPRETINSNSFPSHPMLTADGEQMIFSIREGQGRLANEQIVISKMDDKEWGYPRLLPSPINTEENEGFASISGDGQTMVFTACNRRDGVGRCDLYISYKEGEKWSDPVNLGKGVNSANWDSEPSLSTDGKRIYFSSDRPGGLGKRDLYVTQKGEDGKWSSPKNLGGKVNTVGNEVTPFIHPDGRRLFFASDYHYGMGGYDLFYSNVFAGEFQEPVNLGYPLNTPNNEGSLFITTDYSTGYYEKFFRQGQNSYSLIYEFEVPESIKPKAVSFHAKGMVSDQQTAEPLASKITLVDLGEEGLEQTVSSDQLEGKYLVVLTQGHEYALHVEKEGYYFHSTHFDFAKDALEAPLALEVKLKPLSNKEAVVLPNVFFESGKYELLSKSTFELNKLAQLLTDNPSLKIEIGGHTDNVGSTQDNISLSEKRAKAVYDYLVEQGIASSRLRFKGYGETKAVADNSTEKGRQANRRIEFRVL